MAGLYPDRSRSYGVLAQDTDSAGERGSWMLQRKLSFTINIRDDKLNTFQLVCPEQGARRTEMN